MEIVNPYLPMDEWKIEMQRKMYVDNCRTMGHKINEEFLSTIKL